MLRLPKNISSKSRYTLKSSLYYVLQIICNRITFDQAEDFKLKIYIRKFYACFK